MVCTECALWVWASRLGGNDKEASALTRGRGAAGKVMRAIVLLSDFFGAVKPKDAPPPERPLGEVQSCANRARAELEQAR